MRIFRKELLTVLSVFAQCAPSFASDHLIPEASVFVADYLAPTKSLYAKRLGRMAGIHVVGNVFVAPSFENTFTVHVEEKEGEFQLVCMKLEIGLYSYQVLDELKSGPEDETAQKIKQLKQMLPEDVMDVEADVIEVSLSRELGSSLKRVWGEMLYSTRYPQTDLETNGGPSFAPGYDGTYYHFSFFHNRQPLSGWVWDYPSGGMVAKFVDIVNAAKSACWGDKASDLKALTSSVSKLESEL